MISLKCCKSDFTKYARSLIVIGDPALQANNILSSMILIPNKIPFLFSISRSSFNVLSLWDKQS